MSADISGFDSDPTLYLITSLTAGSSHIVTATSRIETILRANKIPFVGLDTATDDRAKALFQRRARGKKLPLLAREGFILGDLEEIEEWNEYGELKENLAPVFTAAKPAAKPTPAPIAPSEPPVSIPTNPKQKIENLPPEQTQSNTATLAMREASSQAASVAASKKSPVTVTAVATSVKVPEPLKTTSPTASSASSSSSAAAAATANVPTGVTSPPLSAGLKSPSSIPLPQSPTSPVGADTSIATVIQAGQPQTTQHRGSNVSLASEEEIKAVEAATAIPEEIEPRSEDEEEDKSKKTDENPKTELEKLEMKTESKGD